MAKVTQKKTPDWAGATPLFRLSSAQKVHGVASRPLHRKRDRVLFACPAEAVTPDKRNYFSVGDTMKLVRVEGSSKRLRQPRTLTVKEFRLLLERLEEPIRTMCIVAACLGLRASEVAGLQWGDFD